MFAMELMMGGNPLGGVGGIVASCVVAGTTIWAMRRRIPHPTEFVCIGCCYLRGGCHTHEAVNLIIEVHEAANIASTGKVYFYAEAGRFDCQTEAFEVEDKSSSIFERQNLHVRQMDNFITVSLWKKGTISSTQLGELILDLEKDIVEKEFPQMEWYILQKEGKGTVKVQLSFHKVEGDISKAGSPLVQYAMIKAQRDAKKKGKRLSLDFESLADNDRLRFLSKVLEGPLKMLTGTRWREFYFKAVEGTNFRWAWKYWKSKQDCLDRNKSIGTIPLLAISTVLPDSHNRQQFYIKYYNREGVQDLFLSRVDRDRDLWSDGLYEFLDRLRQHLQDHPPQGSSHPVIEIQDDLVGKISLSKKAQTVDPSKRRILGPGELGPGEQTETNVPKTRIPLSVAKMIEEAMTGYEEDVEIVKSEEYLGDIEVTDDEEGITRSEAYRRDGSTGGPL